MWTVFCKYINCFLIQLMILLLCLHLSFHQVKCHEPGYVNETLIGASPKKCGTLIYDHLVSSEEAQELRKMASSLIYELGETNYYTRESLNLYFVNLYKVFREGYKLNIFEDKDFDLINKASKAAKVNFES